MTTISQIAVLPDDLNALAARARNEGFRFIDRLVAEFHSGTNTFSKAGEALFEARKDGVLVGIGGLNRDPYTLKETIGRVRRLYVDSDFRREGVAKLLMDAIERAARGSFSELRLRTDTVVGASFYSQLGYSAVPNDRKASHAKRLSAP